MSEGRDRSEQLYRSELTAEFERLSPAAQAELWRAAQTDPTARQRLIVSILPLVITAVRRGCARRGFRVNDVDTMDLIQSANIRAIRALESWDPDREEGATLAGWVYLHVERPLSRDLAFIVSEQSTVSLSTDFAAGRGSDEDAEGTEFTAEVPEELSTGPQHVEVQVEAMRLREHVRQLPRELREIAVLTYWGDMSSREIAALTGLSHATVSRRLRGVHEHLEVVVRQK